MLGLLFTGLVTLQPGHAGHVCMQEFIAVKQNYLSEQSGAVEACWAHNPEVRGSKPRSAKTILLRLLISWLHDFPTSYQYQNLAGNYTIL